MTPVSTIAKSPTVEPVHALKYVLVTPARNEEAFIEQTIASVVEQTIQPVRWIIVSDGSTDGTDEIVLQHLARHPWIELVRMPERRERDFAGRERIFRLGRLLHHLDHEG